MKIYILTNPELGWDNIVVVFATKVGCVAYYTDQEEIPRFEEAAEEWADEKEMIIHEKTIYIYIINKNKNIKTMSRKSKRFGGSSTPGKSKGSNCQKSVLKTWYAKDTRAYKKNRADWLNACIEVSNMKGNLPTQEVIAHRAGQYFDK